MKTHIRKMGNSQGVIIPRLLLDEVGLKADDTVELKVNKKGRIVITPRKAKNRDGWAEDSKRLADGGEQGAALPPFDRGGKW
jgi:antitoxin MazE